MRSARRLAEYAGYRFLSLVVPLLPRPLLVAIGHVFGTLYWALSPRTRRIGRENLARVFPGRRDRGRLLRRSVRTQAVALLDALWAVRVTHGRARRCLELDERDTDLLHAALERGDGVVLATAHFGSWEMLNLAGGHLGFPPATVIARHVRNPRIDRHLQRTRARTGNRLVYREGALLRCMAALRRGEIVCSVIDIAIVPAEGGVFADFLGTPAITAPALSTLAVLRRAPLFLVVTRPVRGGLRYRVAVTPVDVDPDAEDREAEVRRVTRRLNDALAARVCEAPGAWMWSYKRWKWRPGETSAELFPSYSLWVEPLW